MRPLILLLVLAGCHPDDDDNGGTPDGAPDNQPPMVMIEGGTYVDADNASHGISALLFDVTEVTVEAYRACVDASACDLPSGDCPGCALNYDTPGREQHPVNGIDHRAAVAYCGWRGARLPTDAEWEWAARGRDEARVYPWGVSTPSCTELSFQQDGFDGPGCGAGTTSAIGARPAGDSRDGLQDMTGNVAEWTSTPGPSSVCNEFGYRGGSFFSVNDVSFETSFRNFECEASDTDTVGIRCVMEP